MENMKLKIGDKVPNFSLETYDPTKKDHWSR